MVRTRQPPHTGFPQPLNKGFSSVCVPALVSWPPGAALTSKAIRRPTVNMDGRLLTRQIVQNGYPPKLILCFQTTCICNGTHITSPVLQHSNISDFTLILSHTRLYYIICISTARNPRSLCKACFLF